MQDSDIFVWDSQFETGLPELDRQHKHLVDLVNSLAGMLSTETWPIEGTLLSIFDELADYITFHFSYEEMLMSTISASKSEKAHKQAHEDFKRRLEESRCEVETAPFETTGTLLTFLSRWLMFHIVGTDRRLAKKILAIKSGASEEEAELKANEAIMNSGEILLSAMNRLYDRLAARTNELLDTKRRLRREIDSHRLTEFELRKLSSAVEHSPVSIIITDSQGTFEYVNPKFTELTGYGFQELHGKTPQMLKSGETPDIEYEKLWTTISSGKEWHGEFHNRKKNGDLYWDHASISPIKDAAGNITHYVAIQENITERKLAEDQFQQQKQLSDDIINSLPGIFYMLNEHGRFVRVNPKFSEVTGYSMGEILAMTALDFFEKEEKQLIGDKMREVFENGESWVEASLVVKDGRKIPYYFNGHRISFTSKSYLVGLGTDISERKELEMELVRQATTDMLTGLPNRRNFLELASQEIARSRRYGKLLSVLMIDLDEFKSINDNYGHQTGDSVLVKFAEICRKTMRAIDVTGRLGGEEFAILLPETEEKEALDAAERLRLNVAGEKVDGEGGKTVHFTISVGLATLAPENDDIDVLLSAADKALYEAKRSGRNRVDCFRP
jgi:diguanylate cyclase (GGDEF)-like protein/hemerythrin-like metal-binding protein/PAS domain S-box-containing protein